MFVNADANEYNCSKANAMTFNSDVSVCNVDALINDRKGVKRATKLSTKDKDKVISPTEKEPRRSNPKLPSHHHV